MLVRFYIQKQRKIQQNQKNINAKLNKKQNNRSKNNVKSTKQRLLWESIKQSINKRVKYKITLAPVKS